ncbi:MAG: hypothetical protein PF495_03765 [Spirochaetales bacterium]|nr:hypothetical protein [Spirochaetales bacterium]
MLTEKPDTVVGLKYQQIDHIYLIFSNLSVTKELCSMSRTFTCLGCGKTLPRNPRLKKQKYCSCLACQNARKRLYDRKINFTSKGKLLQRGRNKRWRESHPAHEYQKRYREAHRNYVKRNVEQQRLRNKKRQNESGSMIVKTDALLLQPLCDGFYAGFKVKNGKIVKTDTLMLQMRAESGVKAFLRLNPG